MIYGRFQIGLPAMQSRASIEIAKSPRFPSTAGRELYLRTISRDIRLSPLARCPHTSSRERWFHHILFPDYWRHARFLRCRDIGWLWLFLDTDHCTVDIISFRLWLAGHVSIFWCFQLCYAKPHDYDDVSWFHLIFSYEIDWESHYHQQARQVFMTLPKTLHRVTSHAAWFRRGWYVSCSDFSPLFPLYRWLRLRRNTLRASLVGGVIHEALKSSIFRNLFSQASLSDIDI